jgi:hypothetical protein
MRHLIFGQSNDFPVYDQSKYFFGPLRNFGSNFLGNERELVLKNEDFSF